MYSDRLLTVEPTPVRRVAVGNTSQALLLAAAATALPIFAHAALGFSPGVAVALGLGLLIAVGAPAAIPVVIVFAFVFQNTGIALISPSLADQQSFTLARSYNFLLVAIFWAAVTFDYVLGRLSFDARTNQLLRLSYAVLILVVLYFVWGAIQNTNGAAIYLRNIATPLMCLQIGVVVAARSRPNWLGAFTIMALLALLYGYLELIFEIDFLKLVNGDTYLRLSVEDQLNAGHWVRLMNETGYVLRGLTDTMMTSPFNYFSEYGISFYRLMGPNFHPISFAYVISFFAIVLIAARRGAIYLLAILPLLVVVGSKGAIAYLLLTVLAVLAARSYRGNVLFALFAVAIAIYAGVALAVALAEGNYHALGLIGGLKQFAGNPLGHGLGAGGNLTVENMDWSRAQELGHTDQAMESAVGVLLFQMGVAGVVFLAYFCWLSWYCWRDYRRSGEIMLAAAAFGILVLTANGLLQEEALFAPLALALMTLLAGLGIGRAVSSNRSPPRRGERQRAGRPFRPRGLHASLGRTD